MLISDVQVLYHHVFQEQVVCMLVHMDVDSLCACKILQSMYKVSNIQYTIVGIGTKSELVSSFNEQKERIKRFILINCGGNMNLLDVLDPEDAITIIVIDSHRPIDVVNFYCDSQVYVVMKEDEIESIPNYDDLYQEESEDEDDEPISRENALKKQVERRRWERKRQEIIEQYEETSFIHDSSAMILFEMAWKVSKDNNMLLWYAITGVTSQLVNREVGRDKYISSIFQLNPHMSRLNHALSNDRSVSSMKINLENDLDLSLFRHWSLFESLQHSLLTISSFRVWTNKGNSKLHQFMAEMGISVSQCKQSYVYMESKVKEGLENKVEVAAEKFGLKEMRLQTYIAQHGYESRISAHDMVFAMTAVLERKKEGSACKQANMFNALSCLSKISEQNISQGIAFAKEELQIRRKNIENALMDMTSIVCYGPYFFFDIKDGNPDRRMFSEPIFLSNFGHLLHQCYLKTLNKVKIKRAVELPFIVAAPSDDNSRHTLMVGLPPAADDSMKNLFAGWFSKAAEKVSQTQHDYFQPSIIKVETIHKTRLLDTLIRTPIFDDVSS